MTDDNTKDWANIRIEEPVRDEARDDPRTYTEIMRAGLRVRQDGPTAHDVQEAFGLPDEAIPDDLQEQLDRIESASTTAEERTGTIERKVDDLGGGRR